MNLVEEMKFNGFSFKETFIPFSLSENRHEKYLSFNWEVEVFHRGKLVFDTPFYVGEAYFPKYKIQRSIAEQKEMRRVTEKGEYRFKKINFPEKDFWECCLTDGQSGLFSINFEDWVFDGGFCRDSIRDKKTYDQCVKIGLVFLNTLGYNKLIELLKFEG